MKLLNEARDVLLDDDLRANYDRTRQFANNSFHSTNPPPKNQNNSTHFSTESSPPSEPAPVPNKNIHVDKESGKHHRNQKAFSVLALFVFVTVISLIVILGQSNDANSSSATTTVRQTTIRTTAKATTKSTTRYTTPNTTQPYIPPTTAYSFQEPALMSRTFNVNCYINNGSVFVYDVYVSQTYEFVTFNFDLNYLGSGYFPVTYNVEFFNSQGNLIGKKSGMTNVFSNMSMPVLGYLSFESKLPDIKIDSISFTLSMT